MRLCRLTSGLEWTRDGASCLHFSALGPAPLRPGVSRGKQACHPNLNHQLPVTGGLLS